MRTIYTLTWKQWPKDKKGKPTNQVMHCTTMEVAKFNRGILQNDPANEDIKITKGTM